MRRLQWIDEAGAKFNSANFPVPLVLKNATSCPGGSREGDVTQHR
jgi:hypothetical protein